MSSSITDTDGLGAQRRRDLVDTFLTRVSAAVADGVLTVHEAHELHRRAQQLAGGDDEPGEHAPTHPGATAANTAGRGTAAPKPGPAVRSGALTAKRPGSAGTRAGSCRT